jgi:hypothetical protein
MHGADMIGLAVDMVLSLLDTNAGWIMIFLCAEGVVHKNHNQHDKW